MRGGAAAVLIEAAFKRVAVADVAAAAGEDVRVPDGLRAAVLVDACGEDAFVALLAVGTATHDAMLDVDGAVRALGTSSREGGVSSYVPADGVVRVALAELGRPRRGRSRGQGRGPGVERRHRKASRLWREHMGRAKAQDGGEDEQRRRRAQADQEAAGSHGSRDREGEDGEAGRTKGKIMEISKYSMGLQQ